MPRTIGNKLKLGLDGNGKHLEMTPEMRSTHLYICGSSGTGKSKMLENLIRQDIAKWHESKCGLLVLDPHGSLYDSLINWISWEEPHLKKVPIIPIDLRQSDWTVGYNVLRPRAKADPSVIVSNFVQAMSYVWGADGSRNGVNPKTLLAIAPNTVIISAGCENCYGHPDSAAVQAYQKVAKHVFATNSIQEGGSLFTRRMGNDLETIVVAHSEPLEREVA